MREQKGTLATVVEAAVARLDLDRMRQTYWEQNECAFLEHFLPPEVVERFLAPEVDRLRAHVHRTYVPQYRKAGAVDFFTIGQKAPVFLDLYRSRAFMEFLSRLVGARLHLCPDNDPHACALYLYTEPGDHMAYHYDISYYKSARYTVLLGVVNRSSSRLLCQLHKEDPGKATQELALAINPGFLVIFNGDKLYHAVSALGAGEDRVVFSMQYVINQEMGLAKRLISDMKDAFVFFGVRTVLSRGRRTLKVNPASK